MKNLNKLIQTTIIFISLVYVFVYYSDNNMHRIFVSSLSIAAVFIPFFIQKITGRKFTESTKLIYNVFIFFSALLGSTANFYHKIDFYDNVIHSLSGVLLIVASFLILKNTENLSKWFRYLFAMSFSMAIASIWEMLEYIYSVLLGKDVQNSIPTGVNDTMTDINFHFVASLLTLLIYINYEKRKKNE